MSQPTTSAAQLEHIGRDFPGWYAWVGVAGILYARRPLTSPPWVVRAETIDQLRDKIKGMMKSGPYG